MRYHAMRELEGWLVSLGPLALLIRNDAAPTIADLEAELLETFTEIETIQATADGEGRALSADEKTQLDTLWAKHGDLEEDIDRRRRIADAGGRLSASLGRQTEPAIPAAPAGGPAPDDPPTPATRIPSAQRRQLAAQPLSTDERGRWGWPTFGQFARAVRHASMPGASMHAIDPRLVSNAPTTFGVEGIGEDGGFAVPPDFRTAIMEKVLAEESLFGRTDQLQSGSNSAIIPVDETTPWQSTGGIQAYWEGEADQFTQSKPQLKPVSIRLNKLTALVPVTEELLEDAPLIDSYLRRKAPEKMDYKVSDAIFNGNGVGMPLGLLNSGSLITVSKESGQAADTIEFANVNKMYSRMYARWRSAGVWLINQDIEPQLNSLNHPGDSSPVFMPAGGLSQAPFGTIFGRPVVPHEVCKTLGDKGDIVFVSFGQYMTLRKTQGMRVDTSVHLYFDYDMVAFRFVLRLAGQPWWNTTIARANGVNTLSWAVTLAERA